MGQSKGKIDYQKDVRIIKFSLISKKIIKTDEEFNKILLEEVKYLNNEIETITKELNEMRGKI
jgi:hypothetical protein